MSDVILFADDLTGACDAGVAFSARGIPTRVLLPSATPGHAGTAIVRAHTLECRNLSPAAAAAAQVQACDTELARGSSPAIVFKKVDSTLRGNIGAEVVALMDRFEMPLCVFAPSMPSAGRTTVGGYQLLEGVPVDRTAMGRDPGAPVVSAHIPTLFKGTGDAVTVELVGLDQDPAAAITRAAAKADAGGKRTRTVLVMDAVSDDDLAAMAQAAAAALGASNKSGMPKLLLAGSAGLATHICASMFPEAEPLRAATIAGPLRVGAPVLVMSGTRQPRTAAQLKTLREDVNLDVCSLTEDRTTAHNSNGNANRVLVAEATDLSTAESVFDQAVTALRRSVSGLVVTGGTTASKLLTKIEAWGLDLCEEVATNVPLTVVRGGPCDGVPMVTKAGALGGLNVLRDAAHALNDIVASSSQSQSEKPVIAVTAGDVCGVGPEIILKALAPTNAAVFRLARYVVVGVPERMELATSFVPGCSTKIRRVGSVAECRFEPGVLEVICPFEYDISKIETGKVCPEAGRCSALAVKAACALALRGEVDAIATAPLNKEAMHAGGFKYGGHTELIQEAVGAGSSRLCLTSDKLTVVHATCHVPFRDIVERCADDGRIVETIKLVHEFCVMRWPHRAPRIAIAGINPHCEPIFGDEETRIIQPAIDEANARGWTCVGPIPPDTVFLRASRGEFDTVVAMYHDQGHIPAKMAGFSDTVNVTLGLPIIRTSVDHGTAFDIAGKGIADDKNMIKAVELAAFMVKGRRANQTASHTAKL